MRRGRGLAAVVGSLCLAAVAVPVLAQEAPDPCSVATATGVAGGLCGGASTTTTTTTTAAPRAERPAPGPGEPATPAPGTFAGTGEAGGPGTAGELPGPPAPELAPAAPADGLAAGSSSAAGEELSSAALATPGFVTPADDGISAARLLLLLAVALAAIGYLAVRGAIEVRERDLAAGAGREEAEAA